MSATLIVGSQWGDEGKAKIIDAFSGNTNIIVRFQGGANAGHTVKIKEEKYVFHLIPSGILYDNTICVLGGGMVIDPEALYEEIETLEKRGIEVESRIRIADNAHLLLPYHKLLDEKIEESLGDRKIGTTKRGIGICYSDKINRAGIRVGDLFCSDFFDGRLPVLIEQKNEVLTKVYNESPVSLEDTKNYLLKVKEKIKDKIINVSYYLNMELAAGRKVLLEGAQGMMLDLDFGTYPYVTSSNPTTGGALVGSGISFNFLKEVIGISKAYTTRVGEGPFPTEVFGEEGERLRKAGAEFGATTGRPRRCGWFDVEVIRHSARVNGLTSLALTKLDILDEYDTIKVGIGYELHGKRLSYFPSFDLPNVKVIYEEFPGWKESTRDCRKLKELPKNAKKFIQSIEKFCGVPIKWISVGPSREHLIHLR